MSKDTFDLEFVNSILSAKDFIAPLPVNGIESYITLPKEFIPGESYYLDIKKD